MRRMPLAGEAVAVHDFGRWLDGVVQEVNEASGEFLVDFDDEAEVPAWCKQSRANAPTLDQREAA